MLLVLLALYVVGYPLVRWRKCLVMDETYIKEEQLIIWAIRPGIDCRDTWMVAVKNHLNPVIYGIYWPVATIETAIRGKREKIR